MRVLGIDPGTMVTGYGVVDDINGKLSHVTHGTIEGKRKAQMKLSQQSERPPNCQFL